MLLSHNVFDLCAVFLCIVGGTLVSMEDGKEFATPGIDRCDVVNSVQH
jgi:hypothetical protein